MRREKERLDKIKRWKDRLEIIEEDMRSLTSSMYDKTKNNEDKEGAAKTFLAKSKAFSKLNA